LYDIIKSGDKDKGTDLHSLNAKACHVTRQQSKPLWFGFLFGSSPTLTGYTLLGDDSYTSYSEKEFKSMKRQLKRRVIEMDGMDFYPIKKGTLIPFNDHVVIQAIFGKHVQNKLVASTVGLSELIADLKKEAAEKGYLTMFGGRRVVVRHEHAALNSATQGGGGEVMKYFLVAAIEELERVGLDHGNDFKLQATIYDETDWIVKESKVDLFSTTLKGVYAKISRQLHMKCTFTGEILIGGRDGRDNSWWGCH